MSRIRPSTLMTIGLLCFAMPCFGHNPHGTRDSECRNNLKSLFASIRTLDADHQRSIGFQPTLFTLGFDPERSNRYAYFLGPGPMEDRGRLEPVRVKEQMGIGVDTFNFTDARALTLKDLPPELAKQIGIHETSPSYEFIAACAGDIDNNVNDSPDVWSISSKFRVIDDVQVEAGELYRHVNDATAH